MHCTYLTEQQVDELLNLYFKDEEKKLKEIIDNILKKIKGIEQKDYDDFYSLGGYVFFHALQKYNGEGSFNGYLAMVLQKKIYSSISARNRQKRMNQVVCKHDDGTKVVVYLKDISLNTPIKTKDQKDVYVQDAIGVCDRYFQDEDVLDTLSEASLRYLNHLPKKTKVIALLIADGNSKDDICEQMGISNKEYKIHMEIMRMYENVKLLDRRSCL